MTLFANILQNPLDARARSDARLMNLVVNFLSKLATDEANGSVRRMLSVCTEFERIAKVVLDRAEKESQSRRKRKSAGEEGGFPTQNATSHNPHNSQMHNTSQMPRPSYMNPEMPVTGGAQSYAPSPGRQNNLNHHPANMNADAFPSLSGSQAPGYPAHTMNEGINSAQTPGLNNGGYNQDFSDILGDGGDNMAQSPGFSAPPPSFSGTEPVASIDYSAFQQPFVPQELWQMPMTLEWDWADMVNGLAFGNGTDEQQQHH